MPQKRTSYFIISPIRDRKYIMAYYPIKVKKMHQKPILSLSEEDLNNTLKEILKKIPLTWENQEKIKEIQDTIKSNNKYLKESIIKKYDNTTKEKKA